MEILYSSIDGEITHCDDGIYKPEHALSTIEYLLWAKQHDEGVWVVNLDAFSSLILFWVYFLKQLGYTFNYNMKENQIVIDPQSMKEKDLKVLLNLIAYVKTERDTILKRWLKLNYGLKGILDPMQILCLAHIGKTNGSALTTSGGVVTLEEFRKKMRNRTKVENLFGKPKANKRRLFHAVQTANFRKIITLCRN